MTKKINSYNLLFARLLLLQVILFAFGLSTAYCQQQCVLTIRTATDKEPLPGVNIRANNSTTKGWLTDYSGKASIAISAPMRVTISYVGYLSLDTILMPDSKMVIHMHEDVLGLDEVVVTGAFSPTTSANALHSVKMISSSTIESKGAVNLADVLHTQLNMKVIQDDILGSRVVMHGISGPNVKILIDGVPIVNGSGGNFDLSQFNMNNVERIEVVEGPLSVQYGTNALAGTINIITKEYRENEKTLNAGAYYETVGQYNADIALARGWKNWSISLGGARNDFDGFSSTNERKENWIPRTQYLANAKVKYSYKSLSFIGAYDQMWQHSTSHGDTASAYNSKIGKLTQMADDYYFKTNRLNSSLIVKGQLSDRVYINIVNGVSRFEQSKRNYKQDVLYDVKWLSTDASDHDTTDFVSWTSRGTFVLGNSTPKFTAGYEVSVNSAHGGKIRSDADANVNDYGLFAAIEYPVKKWVIQPALRYAYSNKYDTKEINFLHADLPLLPSLNLKYRATKHLNLRMSYGQGYRTPSVRELYYEFINANHYIIGNTDLHPEIGHNINISANWKKIIGNGTTMVIQPAAFFTHINNKIELVHITDRSTLPDDVSKSVPVARTYDNIKDFTSLGANLSAEIITTNGFHLSPGFGVLSRSGSESDDSFFTSYEANLNASYYFNPIATKINVFYKYNGEMSEFSKDEDGNIGLLTLESYHSLDCSLSRAFMQGQLFTTIGAKNLFDVTDIALTGDGSKGLVSQTGREDYYPISWGRSFFIRINYTFNN